MTEAQISGKVCPRCGFHEKDFAKTLRMGCPHCYEVFAAELSTFLPRMHRGVTHVGRSPRKFRTETHRLERALEKIESLLASNLPPEQSDHLLDEWRRLSSQLKASGPSSAYNP